MDTVLEKLSKFFVEILRLTAVRSTRNTPPMSPRFLLPALAAAFVLSPVARSFSDGLPLFTSKSDTTVFFPDGATDSKIRFEDGTMVVFDIPGTGKDEIFGYARTPVSLRNYRFAMEFAWGTKKFAPRADQTKNSGLLYHIRGADKLWPECFECQVQEGDVGDLHQVFQRTEKSGVQTRVKPGVEEPTYDPSGEEKHVSGRLIRWPRMDKAEGWNAVELTTRENAAEHKVNGTVVARLWDATRPDGSHATKERSPYRPKARRFATATRASLPSPGRRITSGFRFCFSQRKPTSATPRRQSPRRKS